MADMRKTHGAKMARFVHHLKFVLVFYLCWVVYAQPFKAVSLGNWLVTEGWMKPSLFDGIPNNDLLDGTQVQFTSTKLQKYICAENGGEATVVANRPLASTWETFRLWRINENTFNFRVFNKQFVGLSQQGLGVDIVAETNEPGSTETFQIERKYDDPYRVRIKASNGFYLQAISETQVTADYQDSGWEDDNPSVFIMTIVHMLGGEYQITNGYGPDRASQVLEEHRNTYITADDFRFLSENGLNAVRIPVGWWIAKDPAPPLPFVGGSVNFLDNAFTWAQNYGMKVIIDLHAVQGSQNGNDHSGTRDGYQEWGDSYIQDTVDVIDFLAQRYGNNPSLAGIELMNEPFAPGVSLGTLIKYYQAGYDAVRKYTSSAYVILSNRLGPADSKELLSFAGGLSRVAIDVHYYNLYSDFFKTLDVQQNIDFIYNQRSSDLRAVTTSNGPLVFVGEWTAEWAINGASKEDYQRFAKAQLDVYGGASFGWAYWAYNCDHDHWSLKWMIENNYITL
ncbi:probable glucan 1,3-beta-glucosidase A isoform X1 [Ziziphus jujuba]|uniref:Probable glucan 1,3-beta-glucosidase A isoform X1 n=1 Tax=Ziziphus jujuba TaxID=326968 RepID=A0ABM3IV24_ZIZJJ|nr:probable glucan 1,3-beta-glucosidase A isoform X1 [Ziziphus jujuba]